MLHGCMGFQMDHLDVNYHHLNVNSIWCDESDANVKKSWGNLCLGMFGVATHRKVQWQFWRISNFEGSPRSLL